MQGGKMAEENRFKQRYKSGDTPWDIGKPDFNLIQTVAATPVKPCKALEIGCGTGDNAIWLSQQNFQVVGIDASETFGISSIDIHYISDPSRRDPSAL